MAISAKTEAELADMDEDDRKMFLAEIGQTNPASLADPRRVRAARAADLLHGRRKGSARLDDPDRRNGPTSRGRHPHRFRARLHPRPDIAFDDFIAHSGEQGAKDAGKMRAEGKDYIVKDGDVMNFLFNV